MNLTLKMSNLYEQEGFSGGNTLDLRDISGTNCYCSDEAFGTIDSLVRKALAEGPGEIAGKGSGAEVAGCGIASDGVRWIDSGDYHYMSLFFLRKIREPFELVLIDNHPDDQTGAFDEGILSCGNWVREARRLPLLKADAWIDGDCRVHRRSGDLPIYISLDLDVLDRAYFRTDWSQGSMTPEQLEAILRGLSGRKILGIDICGGLTVEKGATPSDLRTNLLLRHRLVDFLSAI